MPSRGDAVENEREDIGEKLVPLDVRAGGDEFPVSFERNPRLARHSSIRPVTPQVSQSFSLATSGTVQSICVPGRCDAGHRRRGGDWRLFGHIVEGWHFHNLVFIEDVAVRALSVAVGLRSR